MPDKFETFLSFNNEDLALAAAEKLKESNINFVVEKSRQLLDSSIVGNILDLNIHIRLRPTDFLKAHKALEDYYKTQLDNVDSDYYLLSFSDFELKEILAKPDEWGYFDYQLAQKLLKERGHQVDDEMLDKLKEDRNRLLAQPDKASRILIFFGYCFIPFGLLVAFFIGRHLFYSKRTLPSGDTVFSYREKDRRHGNRIMVITGILMMISVTGWAILQIMDRQ